MHPFGDSVGGHARIHEQFNCNVSLLSALDDTLYGFSVIRQTMF